MSIPDETVCCKMSIPDETVCCKMSIPDETVCCKMSIPDETVCCKMMDSIINSCRILLEDFIKKDDHDIKVFLDSWFKCDFFYIFFGQQTIQEIEITVGAVYRYAKTVLSSYLDFSNMMRFDILRIIGVTYLLSFIYYTEPLNSLKIGLSLLTWKKMSMSFNSMPIVVSTKTFRYLFLKLVIDRAFEYNLNDYPVVKKQKTISDISQYRFLHVFEDFDINFINLVEDVFSNNFLVQKKSKQNYDIESVTDVTDVTDVDYNKEAVLLLNECYDNNYPLEKLDCSFLKYPGYEYIRKICKVLKDVGQPDHFKHLTDSDSEELDFSENLKLEKSFEAKLDSSEVQFISKVGTKSISENKFNFKSDVTKITNIRKEIMVSDTASQLPSDIISKLKSVAGSVKDFEQGIGQDTVQQSPSGTELNPKIVDLMTTEPITEKTILASDFVFNIEPNAELLKWISDDES